MHFWWLGFGAVVLALAGPSLARWSGERASAAGDALVRMASAEADRPEGPAVLVLLVENRDQLDRLRSRFDRRRILASSRRAFAVEGLVAASNLEAASEPLNTLGWSDRPLDIVSRARATAPVPQAEGTAGSAASSIAELARQDRLSRSDALRLLDQLDRPPSTHPAPRP